MEQKAKNRFAGGIAAHIQGRQQGLTSQSSSHRALSKTSGSFWLIYQGA
jgi:hypothetical protein